MLLANRHSSFKIFSSVTFISLCVLFFLNYYVFSIGSSTRRTFDPFRDSISCPDDAKNSTPASEAVVTVTMSLLPPPVVAPTPVTVTVVTTATVATSLTPYSTPTVTAIPEKMWYKLGPKGLSDDSKGWIDSCLRRNPTFRHEFLTDESGEYYVTEYFAQRRDIVDTYHQLTIPILKADFLRYLILYAEGGIWNDLDVSCEEEKTIHEWIPENLKAGTSLVVGLEFDWGWEDDNFLHSQFASWTIMARPGSRHMQMVIDDIVDGIREKSEEHQLPISQLKTEHVGDVVDITGPKRMTRSIVKSLEMTLDTTIDDRNISGLKVPKLIGDVLIMPGNAFAASQSGYPEDQGPRLVTHHYAGTWKNDKGGEMA